MRRTGTADLILCEGPVPHYKQMVRLGRAVLKVMIEELGPEETVRRFSNTLWFHCLACALGFEYNYTGATTVVLRALKDAITPDMPIRIVGGKGKVALNTPEEIRKIGDEMSLRDSEVKRMIEASRLTAKVDNSLLQDSFSIYFHSMIISESGTFAVINQGMNTKEKLARRYHWYSPSRFFEDPHASLSPFYKIVLNLADKKSKEVRKTILDIVRDNNPEKLQNMLDAARRAYKNKRLTDYFDIKERCNVLCVSLPYYLQFPRKLNEKALKIAREADSFRDLLLVRGMGPSTLRGLAFIASLIYGCELCWKDPSLYCFAHGTKAGKPWMVEKELMVENAKLLEEIILESKIEAEKKKKILKGLAKIVEKYASDHAK